MARYNNNNGRGGSSRNHFEEEDNFEAEKDDYYYDTDRDERRRDRREGRYGDFTNRERGPEWDRERYRDQGGDYDYRRAPNRENREWDRERDYNRERDRDRERNDRYEERPRYDQRNFDRDYDQRDRDSRGPPTSASEKPSKIIMLRGLPQSVDEDELENPVEEPIMDPKIRLELQAFGAPLKEVRLMKRKETGASRGFAFVEFENLQDATRWMEQNQHQLMLRGQRVNMHYSTPKPQKEEDWQCSKCGVHNFKRRDHCFKCGISREESSKTLKEGEGYNEVGSLPSNTLIFRGLDTLTTEETIRSTLGALSTVHIHSIRLIKDKLTHTSRGFCFVEMNTLEEAAQMMEVLMAVRPAFAIDGKQVNVAFAKQGKAGSSAPSGVAAAAIEAAQWSQAQAQGTDQSWDQTQQQYSTEQGQQTFAAAQDGQVTQDQITDYAAYFQSGDYAAYYQQHGIYDLAQYQQLAAAAAQAAAAAGGTGAAQTALEQVQAAQQFQKQQQIIQQQIVTQMQQQQKLSELSTEERLALQLWAPGILQAQQWSQQVAQYQQVVDPAAVLTQVIAATTAAAVATTVPVATATPAAAVTQAAVSTAATPATSALTIPFVSLDQPNYQVYPTPDLSTFQYDETSGYYYDPQTGLYYDASTQYFYNSQTQQYLYWDQEKLSYLPAPTDAAEQQAGDGKDNREEKKKKKEKSAQKIAKDMERWAKSLNSMKETKKFVPIGIGLKPSPKFGEEKLSATADAGFAILEKKASLAERQQSVLEALQRKKEEDVKPSPVAQNSLVDAYGGGSDSEEEEDDSQKRQTSLAPDEELLLDWKRMACLLCKRQFPSKEALSRHQQLSDLHKTNLDMRRRSVMSAEELEALEKRERDMKYRDRAAERRQKFGIPEPPPPKRKREDYLGKVQSKYEEPTKHGIGSENIGNKMLKAMGWAEGTGLGKKKQGITAPITAEKRTMGAGLGMKGSSYGSEAGDTYKESVKKIMRQRYYETS
ncbi:RNA-binding protein 5-like isoform X3 [Branchiostoma lanceolatum]|uniref:RNA-binding protein 5-like isoform X3 n=1 Tax=Branchiostoma lanceolatum TaxID=7740 RepID=UPI00345371D0